jgi:thymidine kinase
MIKVITGSMFSGKSYALIGTLNKLISNPQDYRRVKIFKPKIDTRNEGIIKSRDSSTTYSAIPIENLNEINQYADNYVGTIVIDEAQFLKGDVSTIIDLHLKGIDFIISGLNQTSEQKPFGLMRDILCIATDIEILKAKCEYCGRINADYSFLEGENKEDDILVDGFYRPICRKCLENIVKENKYGL